MTRRTNARIAGVTYLLYIAAGITSMILGRSTRGQGTAATLASIGQHTTDVRIQVLLAFVMSMCALLLGVTLYGITRDEDNELAVLAMASTIFSYLLLRGRMIPVPLAWLGVFASALLVVLLPLQLAGFLTGIVTSYVVMWMPMLVFELTFAVWLIVKGVAVPTRRQSS
jgi:hypothetical protein